MPAVDSREQAIVLDAEVLASADPRLGAAAEVAGPMRVTLRPSGFGTLLHLILEQQVSIAAAASMYARLDSIPGGTTPRGFLTLGPATLRSCGFSRQKAGYAASLAKAILAGDFDPAVLTTLPDDQARSVLTALPGIGPWTADNYLLWALGRRDVFPRGDLALIRGWSWLTRTPEDDSVLLAEAEEWRPRRTAAALLIWEYYLAVRADGGLAAGDSLGHL
jgi:DNA-3-methyladenine glycosylase II